MKKVFLLAISALLLFCTDSLAQKKGEMYVGGTLDAGYKERTGQFGIYADYGYFFFENFCAELGIGYHHEGAEDYNFDQFVINPEIAYYFKLARGFYYTPEFGTSLGWGNSRNDVNNIIPVFNWDIYLNFAAFEFQPIRNLGFSFGVGSLNFYGITTKDDSGRHSNSDFSIQLLLDCTVGVKYYF